MNILEEIAVKRRLDIERRKQERPFETIRQQALELAEQELKKEGSFAFPFRQALAGEGMSFICEVKRASPSKGLLAERFPYLEIAREYERAGAAAISVLTEPVYFLGKDAYLQEIAEMVRIPVLRKDFIIDAYQIYEARVLGASAVLLICALLEEESLKVFLETAHEVGLDVLVEAHDEAEVKRAMAVGANIIGVNNRDLKTFTVDINNSARLRRLVPEEVLFVSESGISTGTDVKQLEEMEVNAVLVGEAFMRSTDRARLLRELAGR